MNLLKMLAKLAVVACLGVAALTIVGKVRQRSGTVRGGSPMAVKDDDRLSPAGFFLLSRDEASNPRVVIMSPPDCPSVEAHRAQALAEALAQAGIPSEMRQELNFTFHDPDDAARVNRHTPNLANPLVLVRGWAKGNPSLAEVVAQYRAQP